MVYVQIHSDLMESQIFQLNPNKHQMEAQAVDTYLINLPRNFGNIKSITVGKQHSYSFFNDWQLIKAELVDSMNRKYIFNCNCWLTTLRYKRTIELTSFNGDLVSSSDSFSISSSRTTRVFPMTIGLLFLLLILIIFTYFGNVMCKKWKETVFLRSASSRQARTRSASATNGAIRPPSNRVVLTAYNNSRQTTRNNLLKDDDDENVGLASRDGVYNVTNNLTDLNVNHMNRNLAEAMARNSHSLVNEDKPPEYTHLFPIKSDANSLIPEENNPSNTINNNSTKTVETNNLTSL